MQTTWQVAGLFGEAYGRTASVGLAAKGFQVTVLWPLDINVFTDADFAVKLDRLVASPLQKFSHLTGDNGYLTSHLQNKFHEDCGTRSLAFVQTNDHARTTE